ncbi:hypothetical protein IIQ_00589 [Bacillus cereus VD118]|uniref:Uncharacterized protein n=1 Tax=Bacillus cereus VD118 TaxID=1053231 RepID=R8QL86_BACCE|nr:hypothetical protein IIQ_00589 [Bacillus cereus VD118]
MSNSDSVPLPIYFKSKIYDVGRETTCSSLYIYHNVAFIRVFKR